MSDNREPGSVTNESDYRKLAQSLSQAEFSARFSCPFLMGVSTMVKPHGPSKTQQGRAPISQATFESPPASRSVIAVRKVQATFPTMITVGRTANNDVVLEDVQVSKFHAYFRVTATGVELADAGSRNGTFVGGDRLQPRHPPVAVALGSVVRFGDLHFRLIDAARAWTALQRLR